MAEQLWADVDAYLEATVVRPDPAYAAVLASGRAAGLPAIDVSPAQGALLGLLVRMTGARSVLEVGTLAGYSTIWMARALPADGRVVTLELDAHHAEVARANFAAAAVHDRVELREGPALDSLDQLVSEGAGPFDLVFIDADKANNAGYFRRAVPLTRTGGVVVVDNVIRNGQVVDASSSDPAVRGTRELFDLVAAEAGVTATVLQSVGAKGYDGLLLAVVDRR